MLVFHKLCREQNFVESSSSGLCGMGVPRAFVDKREMRFLIPLQSPCAPLAVSEEGRDRTVLICQ